MMKRLLCLALACLLLCTCAVAETHQGGLTFSTSEEQLKAMLEQAGAGDDASLLAQGITELLESLRLDALVQDDGMQAGLYLGELAVLHLASFAEASGLVRLTTNLLPEHYLAIQLPEEDMAQLAAAEAVMDGTDWPAVALACVDAVNTWWNALPCQQSTGNFIGDAYTGGTACAARSFDDGDLADLLDTLAAILQAEGIDNGFLETYLHQENPWDALSSANQLARESNRYSYTVKHVTDAEGAFVGLSLVVLDGEAQVMTASLGQEEDAWKLVLGWGLNECNYYLYADAAPAEEGCQWTLLLYQDPQRLGFPTVEHMANYLLWLAGGVVDVSLEAGTFQLDMEVIDPYAALMQDVYLSVAAQAEEGGVAVQAALYNATSENMPEEPMVSMAFTWAETDAHTWQLDGKQRLDIADMDNLDAETESMIQQEVQQALNELVVQLFKVLPTELLSFFLL